MIKKLYLPLVALLVLALSSCGKMGELSSDYFTTNPEVLEAIGGKVPVTINGKFPEKYFKKNATVEVTPVLRWKGGEAKGQPAVFQGEKEANPEFSGKEYILERQLKPEARKDIIEKLAKAGIKPTAMMDISDGLSSELLHICSQSDTGCRVYEERIPIDYQTAVMAEELNMNVTTCALNGGEDYELLFTVPLTEHERVSAIEGIKVIGHITKPELGCALITRDGQEFELKAQGWNPLKEK